MQRSVALLLVLWCSAGVVSGQTAPAVRGTVEDASGAMIAGASVALLDAAGTVVLETRTDARTDGTARPMPI